MELRASGAEGKKKGPFYKQEVPPELKRVNSEGPHWGLFWSAPAERGTAVPRCDGALALGGRRGSRRAVLSRDPNPQRVARGTAVPRAEPLSLPPQSKKRFRLRNTLRSSHQA